MIFITLGSQKFQFNRLLIEVDRLIDEGVITCEVFAQIGYSDYVPKNYSFKNFLNRDEFAENMKKSKLIITHGGTGAIVTAIKNKKKVIAVPRLVDFGEHVDNHQLEIVSNFSDLDLIQSIKDISELKKSLSEINKKELKKFKSNNKNFISLIEDLIK